MPGIGHHHLRDEQPDELHGNDTPNPSHPYTYYLAEGCTRPTFDTYLTIQNYQDESTEVQITYMPEGKGNIEKTHTIAPTPATPCVWTTTRGRTLTWDASSLLADPSWWSAPCTSGPLAP